MKRLSATAIAAAMSLAFTVPAWAAPESLSETQLDAVVAGTASSQPTPPSHGGSYGNKGGCGCDKSGGGLVSVANVLNGNKILSGNEVNVLNGNNTAIGVGILGTGAIAYRK